MGKEDGRTIDTTATPVPALPAPAPNPHGSAVAPSNLFGTDDASAIVEKATKVASSLADVIRKKSLATTIRDREHVRVEGWTLLGTMLGVFPVLEWSRRVEGPEVKCEALVDDPNHSGSGRPKRVPCGRTVRAEGWEARVVARTLQGHVVGAAEALCLRSEHTWHDRDDYALRSMSQTRSTSKALRQPLGFVVTLAGYEATPAEEMPTDGGPPVGSPGRPFQGGSPKTGGGGKPAEVTRKDVFRVNFQAVEAVWGKDAAQDADRKWAPLNWTLDKLGGKSIDDPHPDLSPAQLYAKAIDGILYWRKCGGDPENAPPPPEGESQETPPEATGEGDEPPPPTEGDAPAGEPVF